MAEITTDIQLNRAKKAAEAYRELKAIYTDSYGELDPACPPWETFRDDFVADWNRNRTIVTGEEAEAMFDKIADETEGGISTGVDLNAVVDDIEFDAEADAVAQQIVDAAEELVEANPNATAQDVDAVVKAVVNGERRGRPAGVKTANPAKLAKAKTANPAKAAAKKKGGTASAKAQKIIETYAARDWSRKEILDKLQTQLGMGAAYASTLYQKFAHASA